MSPVLHITDCGLPGIKEIPYGLHMCHFYEDREDLAATLVPYFVAGLQKEERCVWVTAEPLDAKAAEAELTRAGLHVPALVRKGSLIIRDASDWFAGIGRLEGAQARITDLWLEEEKRALAAGYRGCASPATRRSSIPPTGPLSWTTSSTPTRYSPPGASSRFAATTPIRAPPPTSSTSCAATAAPCTAPTRAGKSSPAGRTSSSSI